MSAPSPAEPGEAHARFMREAIALAHEHVVAGDGGPFGALVVRGDAVLARGWNRVTTAHDPTAHAEVEAIRAAAAALGTHDLRGCRIYASCEPCPMCLAACYWARLDRIYYAADRDQAAAAGFDDEEIYREIPLPVADRSLPMDRLLAAESEAPFEAWRAKDDRVPY